MKEYIKGYVRGAAEYKQQKRGDKITSGTYRF
jgi:hypothetical protein